MKKAFTLIELLVVIAIIAILAAIIFPAFARVRERARCTHCINNLHQLGTAIDIYRDDYDGKWPWAQRNDSILWGGKPFLPDVMSGYVTERDLWQCPSDIGETFPNDPGGFAMRTAPFFKIRASSYDYPGIGWTPVRAALAGPKILPIRTPRLATVLMESRPWHGNYNTADRGDKSPALRNVLCGDGSVQPETWFRLYSDQREAVR